ncbi:hypothetical protein T439DRAFT_337730 [Meredithblackwellia eburnea MCA 4105]
MSTSSTTTLAPLPIVAQSMSPVKQSIFATTGTGLRKRVLHFSPAWFAANMGLGITSILLFHLPYQFRGLRTIASIFFAVNVVSFVLFLFMSIARYTIWPRCWSLMINHPVQSMFLGVFSMGFATIGDGVVLFLVPVYGQNMVKLAWALWWIEAVISVLVCIGVPYMMFSRQKHDPTQMTAVWLLPVVSPNVSAAAGAIVAPLLSEAHARLTITISYLLLGLSLPPALLLLSLYLSRLSSHHAPPPALAISVFLPIGPCGQAAFAFLQLATGVRTLYETTGRGLVGGVTDTMQQEMMTAALMVASVVVSLFLVGFGAFWLVLAYIGTGEMWRAGKLSFNLGWWAFTFPVGTMASATTLLASELDSTAFRVVATILSVVVTFFTLFVGTLSVVHGWRGTVFFFLVKEEKEN